MKAIVAVDLDYGIGKNGNLLVHLPEDLKHFQQVTMGKTVVMGYHTLCSLPGSKPLKGRENIVLTSCHGADCEGCTCVASLEELFQVLEEKNTDDVYVIGGGTVYQQLLPYCDEVNLTVIEHHLEADRFFPNISELPEFTLKGKSQQFQHELIRFHFEDYVRV